MTSADFGIPLELPVLERLADRLAREFQAKDVPEVEKRVQAIELLFGTAVAVAVADRAEELANEYEREAWIEYQTELAIERDQDRRRERWEDWADRTDYGATKR